MPYFDKGRTFDAGVEQVICAILVSPDFCSVRFGTRAR